MRTGNIFTSLMLWVVIALPQYSSASSFCATSAEGKIQADGCKYDSYDACKRATGSQGDCITNPEEKLPASKVAPYCIVTRSTECKYYDYETCAKVAQSQIGFCYLNPDYKQADN